MTYAIRAHCLDGSNAVTDEDRYNLEMATIMLKARDSHYAVLLYDEEMCCCHIRDIDEDVKSYKTLGMCPEQWCRGLQHLQSNDAFMIVLVHDHVWNIYLGWYDRPW